MASRERGSGSRGQRSLQKTEVQVVQRGEAGGRRHIRPYSAVAWCYDEIAALYSLGLIRRAKASQVSQLAPGERVLYAGVGRGAEAVLAAERGACVTALDASPAMLSRLRRTLSGRQASDAQLVCCDLLEHSPKQPYDVAAANFFLNVFGESEMRRALAHLVSLVRPGGRLMIADFAVPRGGVAARLACRAYYLPVALAAAATGLAALHPIYDYESEFEELGLELLARQEFRLGPLTPVFFESLIARRR